MLGMPLLNSIPGLDFCGKGGRFDMWNMRPGRWNAKGDGQNWNCLLYWLAGVVIRNNCEKNHNNRINETT